MKNLYGRPKNDTSRGGSVIYTEAANEIEAARELLRRQAHAREQRTAKAREQRRMDRANNVTLPYVDFVSRPELPKGPREK